MHFNHTHTLNIYMRFTFFLVSNFFSLPNFILYTHFLKKDEPCTVQKPKWRGMGRIEMPKQEHQHRDITLNIWYTTKNDMAPKWQTWSSGWSSWTNYIQYMKPFK